MIRSRADRGGTLGCELSDGCMASDITSVGDRVSQGRIRKSAPRPRRGGSRRENSVRCVYKSLAVLRGSLIDLSKWDGEGDVTLHKVRRPGASGTGAWRNTSGHPGTGRDQSTAPFPSMQRLSGGGGANGGPGVESRNIRRGAEWESFFEGGHGEPEHGQIHDGVDGKVHVEIRVGSIPSCGCC